MGAKDLEMERRVDRPTVYKGDGHGVEEDGEE